jgi:DNA polymerase
MTPPAGAAPDREELERVVRQHARTAQMLGVDFLPAYHAAVAADPGIASDPAPGSTPAPLLPAPPGKDRAASTERLRAIRERYERDAPHQHFVTSFNNIVFGEGDPAARLMFVGEAPGAEEDRTGRPFVGRAGQLLDKMIIAMGLSRGQVYIANVLKTRPPNNATPTLEEAERCKPYLFDQIAAIQPEVIVTLGLPAARTLLSSSESMGRLRGHWASFSHSGFTTAVMPTFHPAFLLRQYTAENRAKVWADLQMVMERLGLKKG